MKTAAYLLAPVLLTGLVACSSSDSSPGAGAAEAVNPSSHKVEQCPQMNGRFRKNDDATVSKVIKTERQTDGVTIDDTNVQWVINGKKQDVRDQAGASYVGICTDQKVTMDLFMNNQLVGKMVYGFSNGQDLTIEMLASDRKYLEKDQKESWTLDEPTMSQSITTAKPRRIYFEDSGAKTILREITSSGAESQESNGEMLWSAQEIKCDFNTKSSICSCSMEVQRSAQAPVKVATDLGTTSIASALLELNLAKCQDDNCTATFSKAECGYKVDAEKLPTGPTFCYLTR